MKRRNFSLDNAQMPAITNCPISCRWIGLTMKYGRMTTIIPHRATTVSCILDWLEVGNNYFYFVAYCFLSVKIFRTKFHTDVMSTFSWSLNVCGQKRWYLLRRGAERFFATGKDTFVEDIRAHRDRWADAGVLEFVQRPGEIVFVPSGWYHQVHNVVSAFWHFFDYKKMGA